MIARNPRWAPWLTAARNPLPGGAPGPVPVVLRPFAAGDREEAIIPRTLAPVPPGTPHLDHLSDYHLRRLVGVSHVFNSTMDLDALIPRVLDVVLEVVGAEAGSLWLAEGELVRCAYALGPAASRLVGLELPAGAGMVGDVVASGEPSLVTDPASDRRFLPQIDQATGFTTESVITVPLVAQGTTLGAVQVVNSTDGKPFDQEDVDFLVALADDAAAGIRNARLFEAEKQARDLKALLAISHEITATFDLDRVLVTVVNLAGNAITFQRCALALWEDQRLRVRAISGQAAVERKSAAVRDLEDFLDWASGRGLPLRVESLGALEGTAAELALRFPSYLDTAGAGSLLLLPVEDADGPLGVLLFEFAGTGQPEQWGLEAAHLLANETALAVRNAQLYRDVPFISWLEPLAERRRRLAALPAAAWLRYGAIAAAATLVLTLVRLPLRVAAETSALRAAVQVPARAAAAGLVESVAVREGDVVERGERVARVRDEALLLRVREEESRRELAEREVLLAESRGDARSAALARVRLAEAGDALGLLRRRLEDTWVVAPASGVVLTPRVEERAGEWLEAGRPFLWIGSQDWSELELRVRQADVGEVRVDQRVRAKVAAHPSITFEGRVAAISPAPLPGDGAPIYVVRALLDNREGLLRPGMEARARIHTAPRPLAALLFRRPWRWLRLKLWW
ncbi:MAG TPA: GAF domain-containing protein [Longimicrobiales bacterium]|nr:GAF domain-containing protein [Longimicrobiales bacterium]